MARRLYVVDDLGNELWRSTVAEPTATSHFEKVLDFPSGLEFPSGITSHLNRLYVTDGSGDELWRSTVAEPTATSHFEKVLDFPTSLLNPQGITSHLNRLDVVDDAGNDLWRSTVAEPTATSHFEKVLDFPTGLTGPRGITSHVNRLYVADDTGDDLWRSTIENPTDTDHFEEILDFPSGLVGAKSLASHVDRLYIADFDDRGLWRSTVAEPTATSHFEKVLDFPLGLADPRGITSHEFDSSSSEARISASASLGLIRGDLSVKAASGSQPLVLADFDSMGLLIEAAGLFIASGDALPTIGVLYATSDRGGTDSPLDGDIELGADDAPITRIRRAVIDGSPGFIFNDNSTLALGLYFDTGGAGNDLTIWIQTLDGVTNFTVTDAFINGGGNYVNLSLTAANQVIVDAITTGDRFIFAFTRPSTGGAPEARASADAALGLFDGSLSVQVVVNTPPNASIFASPTSVDGSGVVILTGSANDNEDPLSNLTIAWTSPLGAFANPTLLNTTWTAPPATGSEQDIILTLTVTDTGGLSGQSTVVIQVNPGGVIPPTPIEQVKLQVLIDIDSPWNAAENAWVNRSENFQSFSVNQGRLSEDPFSAYSATSMVLILADTPDRWLQSNDIGFAKISLRLIRGTQIRYLFTGYVKNVVSIGLHNYDHVVLRVSCYDVFNKLVNEDIDISDAVTLPEGSITDTVNALLDTVNWPAQFRDIAQIPLRTPELSDLGLVSSIKLVREAQIASRTRIFAGRDGIIRLTEESNFETVRAAPSVLTLDYGESGIPVLDTITRDSGTSNVVNIIEVRGLSAIHVSTNEKDLERRGPNRATISSRFLTDDNVLRLSLLRLFDSRNPSVIARLPVEIDIGNWDWFALEPGSVVTVNLGLHRLVGKMAVIDMDIEYDFEAAQWVSNVVVILPSIIDTWLLYDSADASDTRGRLLDSANTPGFSGDLGNTYLGL